MKICNKFVIMNNRKNVRVFFCHLTQSITVAYNSRAYFLKCFCNTCFCCSLGFHILHFAVFEIRPLLNYIDFSNKADNFFLNHSIHSVFQPRMFLIFENFGFMRIKICHGIVNSFFKNQYFLTAQNYLLERSFDWK